MPTFREELIGLLSAHPQTVREIAASTTMRIRDVVDHLEHIRRSLKHRFLLRPAECDACGFVFRRRTRLSTPSRCPSCKSERVDGPWLSVVAE